MEESCASGISSPPVNPLDNPIWSALASRHASLALGAGTLKRYPRDVAPFIAASGETMAEPESFASLIAAGERVYALGDPFSAPAGWELKRLGSGLQMVCAGPMAAVAGPAIRQLNDDDRPDVLALTALVYPHYFRPRTMTLGRYFGIHDAGRLVAMAGERMAMPGFVEVSAVCTHPDFTGRGYSRRLLIQLSNDILSHGDTPFLHVAPDNERARQLYLRNGYVLRRELPFWGVRQS